MRGYYGTTGLLAMVFMAGGAMAVDTPAKGSHLAQVRTASVTTVATTAQPGLSATVQKVERYFNDVKTLQADFKQTVTGEARASTGTFYWQKPGKFLWLYKQPVAQKLVSTGSAIYFIDDRQQATQVPTNAGVARLFNAQTLNFSKQGLRATHVAQTGRELAVTFAVEKDMAAGDGAGLKQLTLVFTRLPGNRMELARIDALDTLNTTTRVELTNIRTNLMLTRGLFEYTPGVYQQRN